MFEQVLLSDSRAQAQARASLWRVGDGGAGQQRVVGADDEFEIFVYALVQASIPELRCASEGVAKFRLLGKHRLRSSLCFPTKRRFVTP
eukprot:SAG11_NODE_1049_length_6032_cov_13.966627_2_plen_89_part_00